jgi:hypothetical protein
VVVYYVLLFGAVAAIVALAPETLSYLNAPLPTSALLGGNGSSGQPAALMGGAMSPLLMVAAAVVSLSSACALMLPVTWVYVQTRRKKGFDQSLVQTLIILPLVVAGVVLLVQNSTALAFSLGGIVGAVSFRNTLRDTKDAIYIFLAIVVGVAAGVHALLVAATVSVCFNLVTVIMWWTDFGRTGALLEGAPAQNRLARAKAIANRSTGFISMVDRELLRSMTSEQLEVLTERARDRQRKADAKAGLEEGAEAKRDRVLRIEVTGEPSAARPAVDAALSALVKSYELTSETSEGAGTALLYRVRLKKRTTPEAFIESFRAAAGSAVAKADLVD